MIGRIASSIAIGVLVWIICFIGGDALAHSGIPIVKVIGADIRDFSVILGIVAAVLAFWGRWDPLGNLFNRGE